MLRTDSAPPSTSRPSPAAPGAGFAAGAGPVGGAADGWTHCLAWMRDHGVA